MATNKVVYGDETLIDLTSDTVTEDDVLDGVTFHSADGTVKTGKVVTTEYTAGDNIEISEDNEISVKDKAFVTDIFESGGSLLISKGEKWHSFVDIPDTKYQATSGNDGFNFMEVGVSGKNFVATRLTPTLYDETQTYQRGQLARYRYPYELFASTYACVEDIEIPEPFDESKWVEIGDSTDKQVGKLASYISEKQPKLTAGTNITISDDNVISASGGGIAEIIDVPQAEYLANKEYYDSLDALVKITDAEGYTADDIEYGNGSVADALDGLSSIFPTFNNSFSIKGVSSFKAPKTSFYALRLYPSSTASTYVIITAPTGNRIARCNASGGGEEISFTFLEKDKTYTVLQGDANTITDINLYY